MIRRCLEDKAPTYLSDHCIPVTAVSSRHLRSVKSTSINWLYRAVGELHSAIGLSLLQARWSGTHYRLSFAICLSVLAFFGALLRRYYSRDISASSAIEMFISIDSIFMILRYMNFRYLSIYLLEVCICVGDEWVSGGMQQGGLWCGFLVETSPWLGGSLIWLSVCQSVGASWDTRVLIGGRPGVRLTDVCHCRRGWSTPPPPSSCCVLPSALIKLPLLSHTHDVRYVERMNEWIDN